MDATLYQDQTKLAIFVLTQHIKHISECTITSNKYNKSGDTLSGTICEERNLNGPSKIKSVKPTSSLAPD